MASTTTTTTTTTPVAQKGLTMSTIKAAMPAYFGALTFESAYAGAYEKGASVETFAQRLAGNALERAFSGNDAGVKFLRSKAESLTIAKKHALAGKLRAIEERIVSIKGQTAKNFTLCECEEFADYQYCEILTVLVPPKAATAPKPKATNYKELYEVALAKCEALKIESMDLAASLAESRSIVAEYRADFDRMTRTIAILQNQIATA